MWNIKRLLFNVGIDFKKFCKKIIRVQPCIINLNKNWRKNNYLISSDPHHDMLGGGGQVSVIIENLMGRMENLKLFISGFFGLVILVTWALVIIFLF